VGEERGAAAFRERSEVRDVLAWMRLLVDPQDAAAVVRALARPPIELRPVDLARVIALARRRKLDMVSALATAIESPQVPPDARERIQRFLELRKAAAQALDTGRPDLLARVVLGAEGQDRDEDRSALDGPRIDDALQEALLQTLRMMREEVLASIARNRWASRRVAAGHRPRHLSRGGALSGAAEALRPGAAPSGARCGGGAGRHQCPPARRHDSAAARDLPDVNAR
jgi:superfamily I DNA/RNA helicase